LRRSRPTLGCTANDDDDDDELSSMQCVCTILSFVACPPHYLINSTIFEKKLLNIKCVFGVSLKLSSETFLILRRTERDMT
jgi:hypothetical protein